MKKYLLLKGRALLCLGVFCLAITACAERGQESVEPSLSELKAQQTAAFERVLQNNNNHLNGEYVIPQTRDRTGYDSGYDETLLFAKNTNLRIVNNIGFYISNLIGRLKSNVQGQPLMLDDPSSFYLDVLQGDVSLSAEVLTEVLNDHVFNFPAATVRKITMQTTQGKVVFSGDIKRRGRWLPFKLIGYLSLKDNRFLILHPEKVSVHGIASENLLKLGQIELDELFSVNAPAAKLVGSRFVLDSQKMLPPPKINFSIEKVKVDSQGVHLAMQKKENVALPKIKENRDSFLVIRGGDLRMMMRLLTLNAEIQVFSKINDEPLDFSFYDYRKQIQQGYLKILNDGSANAYVKNYNDLGKE